MCKNVFACLFIAHNITSLSRHEQVCLKRLRFERYYSIMGPSPNDGRSISQNVALLNVALLNILVHDVVNLTLTHV